MEPGAPAASPARPGPVIIEAGHVTKTFTTPDGRALPVLDGVSFTLREGEIVALLGKSGSGKSTLLRCVAGLIAPSSGTVTYRGTPLNGANPGVAMVFQSFALLPWLTVQQNVELAMQARDVPEDARRDKALRAIDLIGLDGFESAYPKELSGGMRQRVGFARALAVEPDALLMDEPFSALDVLTAANLRGELTRLWEGHDFPVKAILIVTHNIEEAVQLADRILVLSSNPGRIRAELAVAMPRPRDRHDPGFEQLVDTVYGILTGREDAAERAADAVGEAPPGAPAPTPADLPLPEVWPAACPGCWRSSPPAAARTAWPSWPTTSASRSTTCSRSSTPPCCSAWPTCTTPGWRSRRRAATSPTPTSTPAKPCSASWPPPAPR